MVGGNVDTLGTSWRMPVIVMLIVGGKDVLSLTFQLLYRKLKA